MEFQQHYVDVNGNYFVASFTDPAHEARYVPPAGATRLTDPPSTDYQWIDGEWVLPPPPSPPTPADVPLTMRQLRLGLLTIGGFSASFIQDAINAIDDPVQRDIAQIWYEETSVVAWDHPMTQQLITAAGLDAEQAAAMWMEARNLAA